MTTAPLQPIDIHRYLTFSFVPRNSKNPFDDVCERIRSDWHDEDTAAVAIESAIREAVMRRIPASNRVGLYLSGGLDSSLVGCVLRECGVDVVAFSLDFGEQSVEKGEAQQVADHLGIPLIWVPCTGEILASRWMDLVGCLDLPFGDAVTGPQLLLGEAARAAGVDVVLNGEGGDQLFGGWTNKPMIAAMLFNTGGESPESMYLRSYHRFHGLAKDLYSPAFQKAIDLQMDCEVLLAPYFSGLRTETFLGQLRLADLCLKGAWNIIPRMEQLAKASGVTIQAPLFDKTLVSLAFQLPPRLKLRGTCEKYILKHIFRDRLPDSIVSRPKSGMCVPITDWLFGPLQSLMNDHLSDDTIRSRQLFRLDFVSELRAGHDLPNEIRRRRIGEKLWTLLMLEMWMRRFCDSNTSLTRWPDEVHSMS